MRIQGEILLDDDSRFVADNYHQLSYAKGPSLQNIRSHLKNIARNGSEGTIPPEDGSAPDRLTEEGALEDELPVSAQNKAASPPKAYFIPDYVPPRRVILDTGTLTNVKTWFETPQQKNVNALLINENYSLKVRICSHETIGGIFLSVLIKHIKGPLKGQVSTPANGSEGLTLRAGEDIIVEWKFRSNLRSGNYFGDILITQHLHDRHAVVLHIEDEFAFKVQKESGSGFEDPIEFDTSATIHRVNTGELAGT
jgi:hypothetical protein